MVPDQAHTETPAGIEIRPYRPVESDLAALTFVRNETLRATTLPEDYAPFTPAEMYAYYNHGGYSLEANAWLLFAGEDVVGAAVLYPPSAFHDRPPGNFHLYILPGRWHTGLGSLLLDYLEFEAATLGYRVLETTIASEDDRSTGFLLGRGFAIVGHSHHLVRLRGSGLAPAALLDGYAIRSLTDLGADIEFYVETANRLGSYDPNYVLIREEDARNEQARGYFQPEGVFLLLDLQDRVPGLIRASIAPGGKRGYLNEIRLEPASRGKGLGGALVNEALRYLEGREITRVELDTAGENVAALNLASRAGFTEARHWLHFLKPLAR